MSDRAREYVKRLDMPWQPIKSFLFLLADYENPDLGYGWAGRERLALVMCKDESQIRDLFRAAEATGEITYEPGNGRGRFGKFVFVKMLKELERQKGEETVTKGGDKGGKRESPGGSVIRNEPRTENYEQELRTTIGDLERNGKTPNLWKEVDELLRSRIDAHSYDTWLRPLFFAAIDHGTLLLKIPKSEFRHSNKYRNDILKACRDQGLDVSAVLLLTKEELEKLAVDDAPDTCMLRYQLISEMEEIRRVRRVSGLRKGMQAEEDDLILEEASESVGVTEYEARRLLEPNASAENAVHVLKRPPKRAANE